MQLYTASVPQWFVVSEVMLSPCRGGRRADRRSWAAETVCRSEPSGGCWFPSPRSATAAGGTQTWRPQHSSVLLRCMYVRSVITLMLYKSIRTCAERPPGVFWAWAAPSRCWSGWSGRPSPGWPTPSADSPYTSWWTPAPSPDPSYQLEMFTQQHTQRWSL